MSKITNFVYCLSVERENENINANNIISVLTPEFVPGSFSFSLIFSVLDLDISKENSVQIIFKTAEGESTLVDSGEINIPIPEIKNEIDLPSEQVGLNMSMDLRNVVFEKEGLYVTNVYINKTLLLEKEIYVKGKRHVQ